MDLALYQFEKTPEGSLKFIREFTKPDFIHALITPEEEAQEIFEFPLLKNFKFWVKDEVSTYDHRYGTVEGLLYDVSYPQVYLVDVLFYCDDGSSYTLRYFPSELTLKRRFSPRYLKAVS